MVSTRSKTTQSKLHDSAEKDRTVTKGQKKTITTPKKSSQKISKADPTTTSRKRKSSGVVPDGSPATKRAKASSSTKRSSSKVNGAAKSEDSKIIINRAPVLRLWGACVTGFVYPKLSWETCLSAGSAISTICAVAKGRSIGTIGERDESEEKQHKRDEAKKKQKDLDVIEVMQFKLKIKDGLALVGSERKGKPSGEEGLKKKFGEVEYKNTREQFDESLQSWKGNEEELNKQAFGFYEEFRPDVSHGQKGWGRKGELDLEKVNSAVEK